MRGSPWGMSFVWLRVEVEGTWESSFEDGKTMETVSRLTRALLPSRDTRSRFSRAILAATAASKR